MEEKLRNGISPAAVTDVTGFLVQTEAQQTLPSMAVSIVADLSGYKRTMTYRNGVWDGYDLTLQFQDDRSTGTYERKHVVRAGGYAADVSVRACTASGSTVVARSAHGDTAGSSVISTSSSVAGAYSDPSRTEHSNAISSALSLQVPYMVPQAAAAHSSNPELASPVHEYNRPHLRLHLQPDRW